MLPLAPPDRRSRTFSRNQRAFILGGILFLIAVVVIAANHPAYRDEFDSLLRRLGIISTPKPFDPADVGDYIPKEHLPILKEVAEATPR